jgi:hypothetical protein
MQSAKPSHRADRGLELKRGSSSNPDILHPLPRKGESAGKPYRAMKMPIGMTSLTVDGAAFSAQDRD